MIAWKDRIEQIKAAFGIKNNRQLEQSLDLGNGYINDLIGGKKNKNPSKIIVALEVKYKVSPAWFYDENVGMFGDLQEGAIKRESELVLAIRKTENNHEARFSEIETRLSTIESLLKQVNPTPEAMIDVNDGPLYTADPEPEYGEEEEEEDRDRIPYLQDVAAGPPRVIGEDASQYVEVSKRLIRKGERYYAASVRGTSMTGAGILDGDMVLIRWANVPHDGAIQVVRYKNKVTLKRMRAVEGKGWELRYMDGSGEVVFCDSSEYEVVGEFETILPKGTVPREW